MTPRSGDTQDDERAGRAARRLARSFRSTRSYGPILFLIAATYVLTVTLTRQWGSSIVLMAQIGTVWLALRASHARRGLRLLAALLLVSATVAAVVNLFVERDSDFRVFVFLTASALYFVAPVAIVRHIGYRRRIDEETLFGALSAYLLIGMAFAFAYRTLGAAQTGPFFGADGDGTLSQVLFFSFITLTTTGYGNLVPAGNPGQSLAVLEALLGQLFLVTAIGKIVSAWQPRGWRAPAGDTQQAADESPDGLP